MRFPVQSGISLWESDQTRSWQPEFQGCEWLIESFPEYGIGIFPTQCVCRRLKLNPWGRNVTGMVSGLFGRADEPLIYDVVTLFVWI